MRQAGGCQSLEQKLRVLQGPQELVEESEVVEWKGKGQFVVLAFPVGREVVLGRPG